jgi:uncharacterized protein YukE
MRVEGLGGSFRTELPSMQAAATHVSDVNVEIGRHLAELMRELESMDGAWPNPTAPALQRLRQRWLEDAAGLSAALDGICESLRRSETGASE